MRTAFAFARGALALLSASMLAAAGALAREPEGLHRALDQLAREGKFSGAVVVRGPEGVRFARGYGWADPYEKRPFTPETPADSASLAKPVTSAAVLLLIRDGAIELDAPVQRYLPEYPHATATVRHLLSHSAGLAFAQSPQALANKSNAALLAAAEPLLFEPGTAFTYCNLCSITLALLIERVTGMHYLEFVKSARCCSPRRDPQTATARGLDGSCNRLSAQGRRRDRALRQLGRRDALRCSEPQHFCVTACPMGKQLVAAAASGPAAAGDHAGAHRR